MNADLREIFRALREDDLDLRIGWVFSERQLQGFHDRQSDRSIIQVDPWKEFVDTIAHEVLHHLEPNAPHGAVYQRARRIRRYASPQQLKRLFGHGVARWLLTLEEHGQVHRCPLCARRLPRLTVVRTKRPKTPQAVPRVRAARLAGDRRRIPRHE